MGKVLIEEQNLIDIADSIREKTGSTDTMLPSEMSDNIGAIDGVGDYLNEKITYGTSNAPGALQIIKKTPPLINTGTSCGNMFRSCGSLESVDLSSFDTSKVTNMSYMFQSCSKLNNIIGLDNLDTSNVTDMSYMFNACKSFIELDLSNFDTSKVTTMQYMFGQMSNLKTLDLSNFDTSNVTSMMQMFYYDTNLESVDLSSFDTSKVTNMREMFNYCHSLTKLDLSNFDTSNVTSMYEMFGGNSGTGQTGKLNEIIFGEKFVTNKVTSFVNMFNYTKIESLDLSNFDFGNGYGGMFKENRLLTNLTFGINYGKKFTEKRTNYSYYTLNLTHSTLLTHDSLMDVINKLYDLNLTWDVANGGTLYTQQLTIGATNLAKLTEEEIAIATAKGWTVS